MSDARGRSRKNNASTGRVKFKGTTAFTAEDEKLRKLWEKLSAMEKAVWGYSFSEYRKATEAATKHYIYNNEGDK